MSDNLKISISEAEWEVMRVVWANQKVTSRQVIDTLGEKMTWSASTIKTLLARLVDKNILRNDKQGRKFIYTAKIEEKDVIKIFSHDILNRVCDKDDVVILDYLIDEAKLNKENIDQLINKLKNKRKSAPEEVNCTCIPGQCACQIIQ